LYRPPLPLTPPRFPPDREAIAAKKIAETRDELGANSQDPGIIKDTCGGDSLGSTAHIVEEVKKQQGRMIWLDTRKL